MTSFYNEIDPVAAAWLRELIAAGEIPHGVVDERDIRDINPQELHAFNQVHFFAGIGGWPYALGLAGWPADRPVWTGSCPCQPFSTSGARLGFDDERHLWPTFFGLIRECRPPAVFGEQVASKDGLGWLDGVARDLEGIGYAVGAADLSAAGVGAPHSRQRLYFVGSDTAAAAPRVMEHADGAGSQGRPERHGATAQGGLTGASQHGRVAHGPSCGRCEERAEPRGRRAGDGAQGRPAGPRAGSLDLVADSAGAGLEDGRSESSWAEGTIQRPERLRADLRVADPESDRHDRCDDGQECSGRAEPEAGGAVRGLGHPDSERARRDGGAVPGAQAASLGEGQPARCLCDRAHDAGAARNWADADWVLCNDPGGPRWRPIEPGTFPLANGIPARVGRLRGYGNAIVPQVAAEFVMAFEEVER